MKRYTIRNALRVIGDIFIPLLPGIITAGLCGGVATLIAQAVPNFAEHNIWAFVHQILTLINTAMMTFLTAWAGYRATERFGGTPILGGMLGMITSLDGINQIASIMGLYNAAVPLDSILCSGKGGVLAVIAGAGQVGAAFALWKKAKKVGNDNLCSVISGALPAGLLGVGEPLIYGVTLPLGKPFLTAGLGAGFGGAFIMVTQVAATTWGPSGLLGAFVMTAGPGGSLRSVLLYLTALVISYIGGYLITKLLYREEELRFETTLPEEQAAALRSASFKRLGKKKAQKIKVGQALLVGSRYDQARLPLTAPVGGETVPMKQIPDVMFSSGVIGNCIGIMPENGRILAPCEGVVAEIADTNHALTFRSADGMEVLLLVGLDTFILNGDGLRPLVKEGERVARGQAVMEVDLARIQEAGLSPIVITVLCE